MTDNNPEPKDPGFTVVVETDRHYWSYLPCDYETAHADARNIDAAKNDHFVEGGLPYRSKSAVYERVAKWPQSVGREVRYV